MHSRKRALRAISANSTRPTGRNRRRRAAKTKHLKEKLAKLDGEMKRLEAYEKKMLASPD